MFRLRAVYHLQSQADVGEGTICARREQPVGGRGGGGCSLGNKTLIAHAPPLPPPSLSSAGNVSKGGARHLSAGRRSARHCHVNLVRRAT
jgi:hypothetical protein